MPQLSLQRKATKKSRPSTFNSSLEDSQIVKIASLLEDKFLREKNEEKHAKTREILALLGKGALLTMALIAPKTASATRHLLGEEKDWDSWKRFNASYLRQSLKRLERQRSIEIFDENGLQVIKLTIKGKKKLLKYALSELSIKKPRAWDRKWRLVIYDISSGQRRLQTLIREALKNLGFYPMQESVYVYPFPCFKEIEFLRSYYGLGSQIQYLLVEKIENDDEYKTYFDLE